MGIESINKQASWFYGLTIVFILFEVVIYFNEGVTDFTSSWVVFGFANAWSITGLIVEAINDTKNYILVDSTEDVDKVENVGDE